MKLSTSHQTRVIVAIAALGCALLFQNCAKKNASLTDSSSGNFVALDADQSIRIVSESSSQIIAVRQAAFYGTYPSQNPSYNPSGLHRTVFESCLIVTNADGSSIQSRPNKSCPINMSLTTATTGSSFQFNVIDQSSASQFAAPSVSCSQSGTTSLVSSSLTKATTVTHCTFQAHSGPVVMDGIMHSTWDLSGKNKLEDSVDLASGGQHHSYAVKSDTLVTPEVPLTYTIDGTSPATLPSGTQYPSSAVWSLFAF